jgi:hypothetical protein
VKPIRNALLVAALAVPAFAQDGDPTKQPPAPVPVPAGGDAAKPAPAAAAKKERKTTPEAEAAIKRYADLIPFPPKDAKSYHFAADFEMAMFGGAVKLDYRWEKDKAPVFKVELPEALLAQVPPEAQDKLKAQMAEQMGGQMSERFDAKYAKYHLSHKAEGDGVVVDITAIEGEKCEFETGKMTFDSRGLLTKQTVKPHLDPNNPAAQMMGDMELEMAFKYAKKGDQWAVESMTQSGPMGETGMKFSYFEPEGLPALPKSIEITSPMMPEPINVAYHDWELNGKAVPGTELKKAEAAKPADKPADKPVDKPADAPTPPAPKTEPK